MNDDDIDYENMFDMDTFIYAIELHEDANSDVDSFVDDDPEMSLLEYLLSEHYDAYPDN